MKHSWQEREDGSARCRRCPAVRVPGTREFARHIEHVTCNDVPYMGSEYDYVVPTVVSTVVASFDVIGAHPSKCGRPAR